MQCLGYDKAQKAVYLRKLNTDKLERLGENAGSTQKNNYGKAGNKGRSDKRNSEQA